jgi:integrase
VARRRRGALPGGGPASAQLHVDGGIHRHMSPDNDIEFVTTGDTIDTIPYVRVRDRSGNVREYLADGANAETLSITITPPAFNGRRTLCEDAVEGVTHLLDAITATQSVTAARSGEILGMRWGEINLDKKVWTVPALRMKAAINIPAQSSWI